MIVGTRHTGLVVKDIEASIRFYEGMGLKVWKQEDEEGQFISTVVGIPEVRIETAKLRAPDGSLLELLQYHSHPPSCDEIDAPSNRHGCSHVAFSVQNLDDACEKVVSQGGTVVNDPTINPAKTVKVAYCHDIDGILLELVQELS